MLTPEQVSAIKTIETGVPVKLIAFAGAGKTSTLKTAARNMPMRQGLYIAFNKSIAEEAEREFPRSVWCKTSHSLAFKSVAGMGYSVDGKMTKNVYIGMLGDWRSPEGVPLTDKQYRSAMLQTVRNYCGSWDDEITAFHLPMLPGLDDEQAANFRHWCKVDSAGLWARMMDPTDRMPLGHDGYVKVWALTRPFIRKDYIMLDEAQDTAQVLVGVLRAQQCQVICVGDSHQAIYEWRGAKDALRILPGSECRLTQSFRFGPEIAEVANRILLAMGETHPLRGNWSKSQVLGAQSDNLQHVNAVLCRTNSGVIRAAAEADDMGRAVYIAGGTTEMRKLVEDAQRLQNGERAETLELSVFTNWQAARDYVFSDDCHDTSLRAFVSLVQTYGTRKLLMMLDSFLPHPMPGCVTISTAHKGKGLQWPSVLIYDDFIGSDGEDGTTLDAGERRLFYVAITRARETLHVDPATLNSYSL